MPEFDLFATSSNAKCPLFATKFPVPGAQIIDAFAIDWGHFYFYAFAPFCLILKTLSKIRQNCAEGIIVIPNWPNQPWNPLLQKMSYPGAIFFPTSNDLLSLSGRIHPQASSPSMIAVRVSDNL